LPSILHVTIISVDDFYVAYASVGLWACSVFDLAVCGCCILHSHRALSVCMPSKYDGDDEGDDNAATTKLLFAASFWST